MHRQEPVSSASHTARCGFCGYEIPTAPVRSESGVLYCSNRCRERHEDGIEPFANRTDFKYFTTGVSALDSLLPQGIPANSFVLLVGEVGSRHRGLQTELLWRKLTRGEPAIFITFADPPSTVIEHFLTVGWNVLPFLERGNLRILDCFTSRLRKKHQEPEHQIAWNEHVETFLDESSEIIRDPDDFRAVEDRLHAILETADIVGEGIVVIDSLNEADTQGHKSAMKQFIKEVRGDICSRKFVPIFTSSTATDIGGATNTYSYLFDGIVEMRRNKSLIEGTRLKQLSIRKMDGVPYLPQWEAYENMGYRGFEIFDPQSGLDAIYGPPPHKAMQ